MSTQYYHDRINYQDLSVVVKNLRGFMQHYEPKEILPMIQLSYDNSVESIFELARERKRLLISAQRKEKIDSDIAKWEANRDKCKLDIEEYQQTIKNSSTILLEAGVPEMLVSFGTAKELNDYIEQNILSNEVNWRHLRGTLKRFPEDMRYNESLLKTCVDYVYLYEEKEQNFELSERDYITRLREVSLRLNAFLPVDSPYRYEVPPVPEQSDPSAPFWGKIEFLGNGGIVGETLYYTSKAEYNRERSESYEIGRPIRPTELNEYQYLLENPDTVPITPLVEYQRLFIDMDGTLAEFQKVDKLETLYEYGYFANLKPIEQVVQAVKDVQTNHPNIEVFILSAYLSDSPYALIEKNQWLDEHLPGIDAAHRVFCPCGTDKKEAVPGGIRPDDYLLDDYTHNLISWEPPAKGIKLLNGINHTQGTWQGDRISAMRPPSELAQKIVNAMRGQEQLKDEKPNTITEGDENVPVSQNGKRYYTQEQFEKARYQSSALDYARARGYNLVKDGRFYSLKEHDSMVFTDNGQWFWNSRQMRGGAIEFIVAYEGKSYVDAILTLADERTIEQIQQLPPVEKQPQIEQRTFKLPEQNANMARVFAYLMKERKLDGDILSELAKQNKIFQSKDYGNAVFVSYDENGKAVSAFQRGTNSFADPPFKRDVAGSNKSYPFHMAAKSPECKTVAVFESCIDAISHATLSKMQTGQYGDIHRIALGGTADNALMKYLEMHPDTEDIILCLDNDEPGRSAIRGICGKLKNDYSLSVQRSNGKDFNEDLQKCLERESEETHQTEEAAQDTEDDLELG